MATEIERKFLLKDNSWRKQVDKQEPIIQGYLVNTENSSVRIRLAGNKASLNIKSLTLGITRAEYE